MLLLQAQASLLPGLYRPNGTESHAWLQQMGFPAMSGSLSRSCHGKDAGD